MSLSNQSNLQLHHTEASAFEGVIDVNTGVDRRLATGRTDSDLEDINMVFALPLFPLLKALHSLNLLAKPDVRCTFHFFPRTSSRS